MQIHFKDIYLILSQNNMAASKVTIRKVETLAEKYILLDSLLFKITLEKETTVLAIPETCTHKIITLYHSNLFAEHQGLIKTYLTISEKLFIPNLIHYLRSYIKGCHICQLACNKKLPTRQPRSHEGHKFIFYIINEVTNYLTTVPINQAKSEEIGECSEHCKYLVFL